MLYATAQYEVGAICYICIATDEATSDSDSMANVQGGRGLFPEEGINFGQLSRRPHMVIGEHCVWQVATLSLPPQL